MSAQSINNNALSAGANSPLGPLFLFGMYSIFVIVHINDSPPHRSLPLFDRVDPALLHTLIPLYLIQQHTADISVCTSESDEASCRHQRYRRKHHDSFRRKCDATGLQEEGHGATNMPRYYCFILYV